MKSMLVHVVPEETQVALAEDGRLAQWFVERTESAHIVGNIYKGRVQNVLPGMQAAFVDIGMDKNAFMYIGDGLPQRAPNIARPDEKVHIGQSVLVQIVKDAIGTKGPRATMHITLPGRYTVLMPADAYIGVSRRIMDEAERARLKRLAEAVCPEGMGFIVRTVAEGKEEDVLKQDLAYLENLWRILLAKQKIASAPSLIYRDADLLIRIVRDYLTDDIEELVIDQREAHQRICDLLGCDIADPACRARRYEAGAPLFGEYGLDEDLARLGERQIDLPSGGAIVIDKTEALTVIDVNTAKFVGAISLGDTVYSANLEAADEIMRQIRLRDIGGIIVVDFIDMETELQKQAVLERLEQLARRDKTKTNVVGITQLGLVEITRKKSRQNYESVTYAECPCCSGRGFVKSPETVAIRIGGDLRRLAKKKRPPRGYVVQMHTRVAEYFEKLRLAKRLGQELVCPVSIESKPDMHPEVYLILQA